MQQQQFSCKTALDSTFAAAAVSAQPQPPPYPQAVNSLGYCSSTDPSSESLVSIRQDPPGQETSQPASPAATLWTTSELWANKQHTTYQQQQQQQQTNWQHYKCQLQRAANQYVNEELQYQQQCRAIQQHHQHQQQYSSPLFQKHQQQQQYPSSLLQQQHQRLPSPQRPALKPPQPALDAPIVCVTSPQKSVDKVQPQMGTNVSKDKKGKDASSNWSGSYKLVAANSATPQSQDNGYDHLNDSTHSDPIPRPQSAHCTGSAPVATRQRQRPHSATTRDQLQLATSEVQSSRSMTPSPRGGGLQTRQPITAPPMNRAVLQLKLNTCVPPQMTHQRSPQRSPQPASTPSTASSQIDQPVWPNDIARCRG